MSKSNIWQNLRLPASHTIYLSLLAFASTLLTIGIMVIPETSEANELALEVGDVAQQDILAPFAESFESELLLAQRQQTAANAIDPIYDLPDTSIARAQNDLLRSALIFTTTVRADEEATPKEQLVQLREIEGITLSEDDSIAILDLSDVSWQRVQQEAASVLEEVMRAPIRDNQLTQARNSIPNYVSLALPEEEVALVTNIVSAFLAPNSIYNEAATEAERENARLAEPPVIISFKKNETIVQRGEVITAVDLEALQIFGLVHTQIAWQDQLSPILLVLASVVMIGLYLQYRPDLTKDKLGLTLIAVLFMLFLVGARISIPNRTVVPYIYPIAGFSLIVTTLFSSQVAILTALPLSILAAFGLPNALDLTLYFILGSIFGALVLKRAQRITTYFWAGSAISAVGTVLILAYKLPESSMDLIGISTLIGASALNGLASASLTILLQFFLAPTLGLTTTLQLHEISRPDHPLLQFILRNSPGTYQHSLQIANLSEQAAELIGANALLTRVGALYHDAGKARYPHFFIENQIPGSPNPHDELTAEESAQVIIRHVADGIDLARKYRLPRRIRDFIAEHHGTTATHYQYANAIEAAGGDKSKVDVSAFHYPGPRPQSRETALVMLADGCEARTRAERPKTREELSKLVKSMFDARINDGQLDDTSISLHDLSIISESFINTLRGVYHPRILYPKFDEETRPRDEVLNQFEIGTDTPPPVHEDLAG